MRGLVSRADLLIRMPWCIKNVSLFTDPLIYQLSSLWFRFRQSFSLVADELSGDSHLCWQAWLCSPMDVALVLEPRIVWAIFGFFRWASGLGCNPSRWAYSLSVYWECWSTHKHTQDECSGNLSSHMASASLTDTNHQFTASQSPSTWHQMKHH